jgi:hypothetical protein
MSANEGAKSGSCRGDADTRAPDGEPHAANDANSLARVALAPLGSHAVVADRVHAGRRGVKVAAADDAAGARIAPWRARAARTDRLRAAQAVVAWAPSVRPRRAHGLELSLSLSVDAGRLADDARAASTYSGSGARHCVRESPRRASAEHGWPPVSAPGSVSRGHGVSVGQEEQGGLHAFADVLGVVEVELAEGRVDVLLDRSLGEDERVGDRGVALALGDLREHLTLTGRQHGERRALDA